ncbi:MAG: phosphotransferase, partial [Gammaproteobacteria bacterium]
TETKWLMAVAAGIGDIGPRLAARAHALARALADRLAAAPVADTPVHGDFYADQVLVSGNECAFLDFDRAGLSDPASDLGNFIAHLERDVLYGRITGDRARQLRDQLAEGYRSAASHLPARMDLYIAAGLLRLAPEPFRRHEAGWPERIEAILAQAESITKRLATCGRAGTQRHASQAAARHADDIDISDPHGAARDPRMLFLAAALTPADIQARFSRHLPHLYKNHCETRVSAVRVVRHKPGRRCLIEYDLDMTRPEAPAEMLTVMGKARARGLDESAFHRQVSLWNRGFSDNADDGVSVPEPVGMIPPLQMWLQRKTPGAVATGLLAQAGGIALAERIAHAIHKLHRANVPPRRRHTIADELRILHARLPSVLQAYPGLGPRIDRLLNACERLAAGMPRSAPCGIHRDFYPDQVLVDDARLWLLDLDLYCEGDPALDVGNFLGHMTEYALRELGQPDALSAQEAALEARYLALADGRIELASVQGYKTLTLARHVHISTQLAERRAFTPALLDLCERRLSGERQGWPRGVRGAALGITSVD